MMPPCIHHLTAQPTWLLLPSAVGFLILLKHSTSLATWLFTSFLRTPKNLKESYGSWALVTGATDGIGKAFAIQLAQKGLNLILVSRNPTKLQSVSEEIQATSPTATNIKTVAFDFSGGDLHSLTPLLEAEIKGLDVGVLINNVGVTYPSARFFHEAAEEVWMNVAKVNVEGTTRVTAAVVKGMVERRRGAIVNIGSGAGVVVRSPLVAIYGASKAYVDQLSRSLHAEYKQFGIDVQSQVPLYVATKLASRAASIDRSSLFVPSPDAYAKAAIRRIGYEARCTPFWAHSVQCFFVGLAPDSLLDTWRLSVGLKRRGDLHHEPSPFC